MKNMKVGEVIELLTTDPGAKSDVPAWSQRAKHQLLRIKEEGGVCKFYVRKAG
jgi:tRNA 2-thiouridine synthesizing protein A